MAEPDPLTVAGIEVCGISKTFAETVAVDDVSFTVAAGEVFALLGPSGCGKSTLLRIIAGLERRTSGRILIGGRDVTAVPPRRRGLGMVFQSYALFPHMSVADNTAYGLRLRGVEASELRRRIGEALELVGLSDQADRYPSQLSGGQQQRVAIARALVVRPSVLLLDEPFGALDLKLRRSMQLQLRDVLRQVGTTAIHVTHDQEEAFTLGDRIGVMNKGQLERAGTGAEVYGDPSTAFVASFLGDANILPVERIGGRKVMIVGESHIELPAESRDGRLACLRPERVGLTTLSGSTSPVRGLVRSAVFLGDCVTYEVDCAGQTLRARLPAGPGRAVIAPGETVAVEVPSDVPLVRA